jgi:methylmalonyl-CoA mutase cobalamin-binding subunit
MQQATRSTVLVGIREIAEHLRRGPKVVRRLIRDKGLPVTLEEGAYMTTPQALDLWVTERATRCGHKQTASDHKETPIG